MSCPTLICNRLMASATFLLLGAGMAWLPFGLVGRLPPRWLRLVGWVLVASGIVCTGLLMPLLCQPCGCGE